MNFKFNKVGVLGTGVMGAQIAAHLTNAGIEVYAFDMTQEVAIDGNKIVAVGTDMNFNAAKLFTLVYNIDFFKVGKLTGNLQVKQVFLRK